VSQLIRLVYASRSTFESSAKQQGLDPGVARILAKSRKNNARAQVVGGLLFGEGYFLQCLEGEADAVNTLYDKIKADPRHRDVTVLAKASISSRSFGAWSMKYVPGEQHLQALLQQWGLARFDPYGLTAAQIEVALRYMQGEADAVITVPAELDEAGSADPRRKKPAVGVPGPRPQASLEAPSDHFPGAKAGLSVFWVWLSGVGVACAAAGAYLTLK
jgi:Sensors of blue-light using FAD